MEGGGVGHVLRACHIYPLHPVRYRWCRLLGFRIISFITSAKSYYLLFALHYATMWNIYEYGI